MSNKKVTPFLIFFFPAGPKGWAWRTPDDPRAQVDELKFIRISRAHRDDQAALVPDRSCHHGRGVPSLSRCQQHMDCSVSSPLTLSSRLFQDPWRAHLLATSSVVAHPPALAEDESPKYQDAGSRNLWSSCTDAGGARLDVRPHWAKEWEAVEVPRHACDRCANTARSAKFRSDELIHQTSKEPCVWVSLRLQRSFENARI